VLLAFAAVALGGARLHAPSYRAVFHTPITVGFGAAFARFTVLELLGASAVAEIGFTVALFIAPHAFRTARALLDEAKVGILGGSLAAGVAGSAVLALTPPSRE
jgi:Na+/H+ antiporter NhaA